MQMPVIDLARKSQDVRTVSHGGVLEHAISIRGHQTDPLAAIGGLQGSMVPLAQFVFGGSESVTVAIRPTRCPLMRIRPQSAGNPPSGAQVFAVRGTQARDIMLDGQLVGRTYRDADADYCYLAGLLPADQRLSRQRQARSCFERIEAALQQAGMDFPHVVRTWLYLDRLLDWYDEFNAVRTTFFDERGVFARMVPASTGIGAANPAGAALVTGALAIKPRTEAFQIYAVPSPLQCPAINYRSAFSRAVEVARPGLRQLYISGTASIAAEGASAHQDDPVRQIELTMAVVSAILQSRQMDWSDATRMIAYFTDMADVAHFNSWCAHHELTNLPVVFAHATVCRSDLLFEVELDAASSRGWCDPAQDSAIGVDRSLRAAR